MKKLGHILFESWYWLIVIYGIVTFVVFIWMLFSKGFNYAINGL